MCGVSFYFSTKQPYANALEKSLSDTGHRGPDFSDLIEYDCQNYYLGMGHNRLKIIDLSSNANQPMVHESGVTLIFNGEIYNHSELREELEAEGLKFSTSHSDTEVLLLGLSHHGLDFIDKIVGQFAIVFIDEEKQTINLIRDRLGQKPLFYRFTEDSFIFSSNFIMYCFIALIYSTSAAKFL